MNQELLSILEQVTEEEQEYQKGSKEIQKKRYTTDRDFTVESNKMLEKGQFLSVRPHTRFVHFPLHKHDYIEVFYVCRGTVTHKVLGEQVAVGEGELLLLGRNTAHEILPAGREDIGINLIVLPEFFDIAFHMIGKNNVLADFLVDSLRKEGGKGCYLYFQVSKCLQIQNLMENILYSLVYKQGNEEKINQITMGLLFLNLLNHTKSIRESAPNQYKNMILAAATRYIQQNYKTATLTELCDIMNQPLSSLSRMIKETTGSTFKALLMERRMEKAEELLIHTKLPFNDIVAAVGYENNSYFYRKFYETHHMTPKEFRKQYSGN